DIFDDIDVLPVSWPAGGNVHSGFARALGRVKPKVDEVLEGLTPPIVMTGHSLGAALATLAASLYRPSLLVTFGSPRVGAAAFRDMLASAVVAERYVDCCDIVCHLLPPPYEPVGRLHYIDRNGDIRLAPAEADMKSDQFAGH